MSNAKKTSPFVLTIMVAGTDGTKTKPKEITVTKPCTLKELFDLHGYAYDKHDVLLDGKVVTLDTVVGEASTVALKKHKAEPKPAVEVRERPQGS